MAILNLAGNIQPDLNAGGKNLPQIQSRVSSVSTSKSNRIDVSQLAAVTSSNAVKPADVGTDQNAKVNQEEVQNQIDKLQQFNQNIDRSLQFKVDEDLGVTIVRVIDKATDELIRQFPPEELLNLSRRLKELNEQNSGNSGVLLQEKI